MIRANSGNCGSVQQNSSPFQQSDERKITDYQNAVVALQSGHFGALE